MNQGIAFTNPITSMNSKMFAWRNKMLDLGTERFAVIINWNNPYSSFATTLIANLDNSSDFGHNGWITRAPSFEDFSNAWETASNILCTRNFARSFSKECSGRNHLAFPNFDDCFFRHVKEHEFLATLIINEHLWMKLALMFHNYPAFCAGNFITFLAESFAFNNLFEGNFSATVSDNRNNMWIPFTKHLAGSNLLSLFNKENRSVRNSIGFKDFIFGSKDFDFTISGKSNFFLLVVDNDVEAFVADGTSLFGLMFALAYFSFHHPTDVEGTHGKLCTRFPNGLGSNDTNSHAFFNKRAG